MEGKETENQMPSARLHVVLYVIIAVLAFIILLLILSYYLFLRTDSIQSVSTEETVIVNTNTNANTNVNVNASANTNGPSNTNTATNTNAAVKNVETYTNEVYGYSLALPKEWKEYDALAGSVLAASPSSFTDESLVITGVTDLTFQIEVIENKTINEWLTSTTFEEEFSKSLQTDAGDAIEVYLGGLESYVYLVAYNNDILKIYTRAITDERDAIAKSFLALDWRVYTSKPTGFSIEYPSNLEVYTYEKLYNNNLYLREKVNFGSEASMDLLQRLIENDIATDGPVPQFTLTIDSEDEGANKALACSKLEVQDGNVTFGKFTVPKCTRTTGEIMFPYITYAFLSSDGTRFHFLTGPDNGGLEANDKLDDHMLQSYKNL